MILTRMTAAGTDGSRVMLWFDDGTKMKVPTAAVGDFGLYAGMPVTEDFLSELLDAAQRASAKARAVRIVSAAAVSERELRSRLTRKGERPEDADAAVDWLRELGALDDGAMAQRSTMRFADKGYGESRVRQELYRKGIPREYWEEALSLLPDMSGAIDRFLERRFGGEAPEQSDIKKTADALARRGHSWEDISAGLRRYTDGLPDEE